MNSKRTQVTVFIIIAIVLVAVIIGFFVLRGRINVSELPASFKPVEASYLDCISSKAEQGKEILSDRAGYKELCVRVNGKDECGFKKVSTSFALNYVSDKYYEEQLATKDIRTKQECVSGEVSLLGMTQTPNIQEGVENVINPGLEKKGVVRICSSTNPGQSTEPQRWQDVGYCDDEKVRCWLDMKTVQDVIKNTDIQDSVVKAVSGDISADINSLGAMPEEGVQEIFTNAKKEIDKFNESVNNCDDKKDYALSVFDETKQGTGSFVQIIADLDRVRDRAAMNNRKAEAVYYKFLIYYTSGDVIGNVVLESEKDTVTTAWDDRNVPDANTPIAETTTTSQPAEETTTAPASTTAYRDWKGELMATLENEMLKSDAVINVKDNGLSGVDTCSYKEDSSGKGRWVCSKDANFVKEAAEKGWGYVEGIIELVKKTNFLGGYIETGGETISNYGNDDKEMAEE